MTSDCTIVTSEQHLYQTIAQFDKTIVLPRKLATGNIHEYLFCYCPLVGILFEVLRVAVTYYTWYTPMMSVLKSIQGRKVLAGLVTVVWKHHTNSRWTHWCYHGIYLVNYWHHKLMTSQSNIWQFVAWIFRMSVWLCKLGGGCTSIITHGRYAPQLPHSYYFTTRILVLKFANKGVFFEEIQDLHFPRKRGYFGIHICEFGEKGVNFDVQYFTMKKGGSFGLKSQCFIT